MLCLIKYFLTILVFLFFGFTILSRLVKSRSLVLLLSTSFPAGLSFYIFLCHLLSFVIGPKLSSILSIVIMFLISLIIFITRNKDTTKIEQELSKNKIIFITTIAITIGILSYFSLCRFGIFDRGFHYPAAISIFHNNTYPPRDLYRPEYVLVYHYGGDLLIGALHNLSGLNVPTSFEVTLSICSAAIFLGLFALVWILTKNYTSSLLGAFCSYFGGGILWLDAIIRYCTKNLPDYAQNLGFFQTLTSLGIHGGITDAPSILTFTSTFGLGYPILIYSIILFWEILKEKQIKSNLFSIFLLTISLLSLFLTADWLYMTFWGTVTLFVIFFLVPKKEKQALIIISILLISSIILNKSLGNALFLQDTLQHLGRANTLNIALKEKPFWLMSWRVINQSINGYQPVSFFSWDFLCEFGFSIILFPIALIYLFKSKNKFGFLLFFSTLITFPLPLLLDYKFNPVELNRLFSFGNTMLILLIVCGIQFLYKNQIPKLLTIILCLSIFCISPFSGLILSSVFTPKIYDPYFSKSLFQVLNTEGFKKLNQYVIDLKNHPYNTYRGELEFLEKHSKPGDVAISNLYEIPTYAGVYSIIPPKVSLFSDLLYSTNATLYQTIFSTLDPHLLHEMNIKWVIVSNDFKNTLPSIALENLKNKNLFRLVYKSKNNNNPKNDFFEIYKLKDIRRLLDDYPRTAAWLLLTSSGQPILSNEGSLQKILLFSKSKSALAYLKALININPSIKNTLITAQLVEIKYIEDQIKNSKANIVIEKRLLPSLGNIPE